MTLDFATFADWALVTPWGIAVLVAIMMILIGKYLPKQAKQIFVLGAALALSTVGAILVAKPVSTAEMTKLIVVNSLLGGFLETGAHELLKNLGIKQFFVRE